MGKRDIIGRQGERGYNLVILVFMITLMHIALAVALPLWSHAAKREKEEELIFRGLQYAEAIRVFQQRVGRSPVRLEELLEVEPGFIRQLYPDPMSENGAWGLLVLAPVQGAQLQQQGQQQGQGSDQQNREPLGLGITRTGARRASQQPGGALVAVPPVEGDEGTGFGRPRSGTRGPIQGVYSAVSEDSVKVFMGATNYSKWQFVVSLIPVPQILDGDAPLPRANSGLIGRPFPQGLQPRLPNPAVGAGSGPGAGAPGQDLTRPNPSTDSGAGGRRGRARRRN